MTSEPDLAWIASVVGDPARLRILLSLMDGRARTAKELAFLAGIAAPTASGHLSKLLDSRLVAVEPQGRHRYYRIASPLVAQMVETMSVVAGETSRTHSRLRRVDPALAAARTCYDHPPRRRDLRRAPGARPHRLRRRRRRGHRKRASVLQRPRARP
ncbi:MAG TPA: winged helix-turn-helix domain-containing protein [Beijerinckiaceae bacterium]|nr:winged helix-turn-helix domain-containing protein [Beijerinckiaceae bacterium]